MNAEERKKLKRTIDSKEIWKERAQDRQRVLRLQKLRIRDLEYSRNQWKEKYSRIRDYNIGDASESVNSEPCQASREVKKTQKRS